MANRLDATGINNLYELNKIHNQNLDEFMVREDSGDALVPKHARDEDAEYQRERHSIFEDSAMRMAGHGLDNIKSSGGIMIKKPNIVQKIIQGFMR